MYMARKLTVILRQVNTIDKIINQTLYLAILITIISVCLKILSLI